MYRIMFDGNETLDSMKCVEFLDEMKSCQLPKRDSVPCRASSKLYSPLPQLCICHFSQEQAISGGSSYREKIETVRQYSSAVRVLPECIVCYLACVSLAVTFVYCKDLRYCYKSSHIMHISQYIIVFSLYFIYTGHSERCSRLKLYVF